jgi:hypothetical protein
MAIVEDRVKPDREGPGRKADPSAQGYARLWWQFARRGVALYDKLNRAAAADGTSRAIAVPLVLARS